MTYVPVIGLEVHAELTTKSKLFCRCPNTSSDLQTKPNSAICPVCLGLPGALPVLNQKAVDLTVRLGRSLGCTIAQTTKWDRKNYFYPDLPKGYQISQYDQPLCQGGTVEWFDRSGQVHTIALTRIHLEEDTGKLTHPAGADFSLIDYNRSSIPLIELVTEPVITSAEEAKQLGEEYQRQLRELGVAAASMEKGQLRCEANISVVPTEWASDPSRRLKGTKVEIKNLNSFRSLERAINYEIERQTAALASGGTLRQETRGWNEVKGETYSMRVKETADDYRYFPEPDLRSLQITSHANAHQVSVRSDLFKRLIDNDVAAHLAHTITNDPARTQFLNDLLAAGLEDALLAKAVQWITQEPAIMDHHPEVIKQGLALVRDGLLPASAFKEGILTTASPDLMAFFARSQAAQHVDDLAQVVASVLEQHPDEVARYREGKTQLFGFFVSQLRQKLEGRGNPAALAEEIKRQLG